MPMIIILCIVTLLAVIQLWIYRGRALKRVDAEVHFSNNIANHGDVVQVVESISNRKKLPIPIVIMKFEAPRELRFLDMTNTSLSDLYYREDMMALRGYQKHTRTIQVECAERGFFEFKRFLLSSTDLLFLSRFSQEFSCHSTLLVLPEVLPNIDIDRILSAPIGDQATRRALLSDPFSFSGIREYEPFDSFRAINWKATAKKDELMVNQLAYTLENDITILLNVNEYNTKGSTFLTEKSIAAVYTLLLALEARDISAGVYSNSKDKFTKTSIAFSAGNNEDQATLRGMDLARIDLRQKAFSFDSLLQHVLEQGKDRPYLVIVSAAFDTTFQENLASLVTRSIPFLWILPWTKESGLPAINDALMPYVMDLEVAK